MLFSIITVVKDAEKTIEKCRKSVLHQSHKSWEHIIFDGLSSDKTLEVVNSLNKKNLIVCSEKDSGMYDAMNKAIKCCKGKYILFLHSDDFLYSKDILEQVSKIITKYNPEIIYGDIIYNDRKKNKLTRYWKTGSGDYSKIKWGWRPPHTGFIILKDLCHEINGYNLNYKIASDVDFVIRAFKNSNNKSCYLEKIFVDMAEGGVSSSTYKNLIKQNYEQLLIVNRNFNLFFIPTFFFGKLIRSIFHFLIPSIKK